MLSLIYAPKHTLIVNLRRPFVVETPAHDLATRILMKSVTDE
jgi:hypothetical protein